MENKKKIMTKEEYVKLICDSLTKVQDKAFVVVIYGMVKKKIENIN